MKVKGEVNLASVLRKLRFACGSMTSSHMNLNSVPGLHLSVAAALTVGGLILALRELKMRNACSFPWLSGRDGGESGKLVLVVPGLQNLGNNCFLNVILQALSSCSCFRDYLNNILDEYDALPIGHVRSMLPLTVALADLMEELNIPRDRKVVLSPSKVMRAVQSYSPNFSLAIQQDAAEAFLHLLCSLREEVLVSYVPNYGSLADVSAVPRRILDPSKLLEDQNERERWKELYLGPFDGIVGNILTCQSCSFQIMMDFEFFHSLPLLPVTGMGTSIFYGCSLENCLKQYIAPEEVEGYKCDRCWHIAALKYISATNGKELHVFLQPNIDKIRYCSGQENCDCRFLPGLEVIPVPVSCAFKQLNIARTPEILCIQLLRATTNLFGDLIKLEGHISFPLILNLCSLMNSGMETVYMGSTQRWHAKDQSQLLYPLPFVNRQIDAGVLSHMCFPHQEKQHSETKKNSETSDDKPLVSADEHTNQEVMDKHTMEITAFRDSRAESEIEQHRTEALAGVLQQAPHVPPIYQLVSVVEHMGKTGGGHYTVYRRMRSQVDEEETYGGNMASSDQWVLISDSDVHQVLERDVLAAQASILFYKRVTER